MDGVKLARKTLAVAILATSVGVTVEATQWEPRMWRAPLTGGLVLGAAAAVIWANRELAGEEQR